MNSTKKLVFTSLMAAAAIVLMVVSSFVPTMSVSLAVIAGLFVKLSGGSLFIAYSLILWGSVVCSAFIDNIPYVAAMLPVTAGISATLGVQPTLLYFGLLIGATLGGNLTPVGASANITGIGMLRTAGHDVSNKDFMRIGVPFTLTAVMAGYILVWLLWA